MKSNSKKKQKLNSLKDINNSILKFTEWHKKSIGLSVNLQKSLKYLEIEVDSKSSEKFLKSFEEEPIIQEMYEWFAKVKESNRENKLLSEISNIIEAYFDRLKEQFGITIIAEPNTIINCPAHNSRYYRFENKYSQDSKKARVLRCGLKMGSKVISPCIVAQIS